jgi:hypothetical protein
LQTTIARSAQGTDNPANDPEANVRIELQALEADLRRLVLFAEESGEGWTNPNLGKPIDSITDRPWASILKAAGVTHRPQPEENRNTWKRIHEAVRHCGGHFYSQDLFGQM